MVKKAAQTPVAVAAGGIYPRPSFYGLSGGWFKKLEEFTEELVGIAERHTKATERAGELEAELRYQQAKHDEAMAQAARNDTDEPAGDGLRTTEKALEKQEERVAALERARYAVQNDLETCLQEGPPQKALEQIRELGEAHEELYAAAMAEAEHQRAIHGGYVSLSRWARRAYPSDGRFRPTPLGYDTTVPWF